MRRSKDGLIYINHLHPSPEAFNVPQSRHSFDIQYTINSSSHYNFKHAGKMQLTSIIIPTILAFSTGAHAWRKDEAGNWVANDNFHDFGNSK